MSSSLARYLKDFGDPQAHQPTQPLIPDFTADMPAIEDSFDFDPEPVVAGPDLEAVRQEAYAEGYETASVEYVSRHADEIAELERRHAEEIAELRKKFEQETAATIARELRHMAEIVALGVSEELANCIAPVLQEEIARKSVQTMAALVKETILEGEAGQIIVKGPLSLFNILATEMGEDAGMLRFVEAADLDLTVEQGGSVLVTRLSAFAASLKKVLE